MNKNPRLIIAPKEQTQMGESENQNKRSPRKFEENMRTKKTDHGNYSDRYRQKSQNR